MENTGYVYPARENAKGTYAQEDLVRLGDKLERWVFDKKIVPLLKIKQQGTLLDIGTGEGRYALYFGKHANKIILVEPDEYRLQKAVDALHSLKATIEDIHGTVSNANIECASVDLALCIHVLQHIHEDDASAILIKAREWLKEGGFFVLAFTKKTKIDSEYNIGWKENGTSKYGPTPKTLFDIVAKERPSGIIPVRKIPLDEVRNTLKSIGFDVISEEAYTPKLHDLYKTKMGRLLLPLYKVVPVSISHRLLHFVGYSKFVDVVMVARKR
jgi:ubiquinone/menaquinone biosynthesis C-methylase UbiE